MAIQKKIKNISILFLTLVLVIGNVLAAPYSQINLISNPGFETGSLSSWTATTGSLTSISVQSGTKQSGSYAVEYYLNSATSGVKYGSLSQSVNFDSAGTVLKISTLDHASGGTGYTYFNIYADGTGIANWASDTSSGNWGTWVNQDLAITGLTGTKTLIIEVGYGSNHYGDVYLDSLVMDSVSPTASFTGTPVVGKAPLTVAFTNADTHTTAYDWDFGDGSAHSSSPNPSHDYSTANSQFTVIHTATNLGGGVSQTRTNYITTNATVVAIFSGTPLSGNTPLSVTFTDASTGSPTAWNWSFGDGYVSSTHNPTHSYNTAGSYSVRLDITAPDGTAYNQSTNYVTATGTAAHTGMAIGGRIYDKLSLLGLNAVQMTLVNTTSSWTTTTFTNTTGYYAFNNLSTSLSNNYVISAVKAGYLDTATDPFTLTASEVSALYADKSFGMEVIGSSSGANQGLGGKYAPNLVRFTIKYWYGEPIKGVNVTAQGFESTAGSGTFADAITTLGSLFGFDFVTTPIASTLMTGTTGDDGSITFYMVENVNYHMTFFIGGTELVSPMNVYPKEFEYPITVPSLATANSGIETNSSFTSGSVNNSYSYITVSYTDTNYHTSSASVTFEKIINSSYNQPISTTNYVGASAANFSKTYYPLTHAGDQYYATLNTVNPDFGTRNETKLITIPGRTLDLRLQNTDYYAWISLIAIYFVAQMGGSRRTRDVAILMSFFALFLTIAGWLSITTLLIQAAVMFAVLYYIRTAEDQ